MGKFTTLKQTLGTPGREGRNETEERASQGRETLPIEQLAPSPRNHRKHFNRAALADLIASIKTQGILEPLLVRPREKEGYEIVSGERRYRAAREIGLTEVPCNIREMGEREALEIGLTSNFLRDNPNPYERTKGLLELLAEKLGVSEEEAIAHLKRMRSRKEGARRKGEELDNVIQQPAESEELDNVIQTPEEIIAATLTEVGGLSWESFLKNNIPVLSLPEEILSALDRGELSYNSATAIARVGDEGKRSELLEVAIAEKLSVGEVRRRVKEIGQGKGKAKTETLTSRLQRIRGGYQKFEKKKAQYEAQGGRAAEVASELERKLAAFAEESEKLLQELEAIERE